MAGESFAELISIGNRRGHGKTSVDRTSLNKDIDEAQGIQEVAGKKRARVDAYERAVTQQYEGRKAKEAELTEKFGTADPEGVAALQGTGLFTDRGILPASEINSLMRLDPVGTRAMVDRAVAISGESGALAITGEPDTSQYMEGIGQAGERFFTNRTRSELSAPSQGDMDVREDVTDLKEINPLTMGGGGNIGGGGSQDPARLAFEGRLAQAKGVAEKPERDKKRVLALDKYLGGAIDRAASTTDVTTELGRIKGDLESGALEALGLRLEDAAQLEKALVKRAKTPLEMAKSAGAPADQRLPWTRKGQPGIAADPALPADILNPGGGPSVITQARQREMLSAGELDAAVQESVPGEVPRTNHYAKGGKAPQTKPRSSLDRGGRGGGVMSDVEAFTSGEGRHGYGEEGPVGMMKDIGAFYGPRLPGDIFAATLGGKGVGRAARSASKLRSVENMFGLF